MYEITAQEYFEAIPVKAVQSVLCAEPHEPFFILQAANDGIVGQSVLYLEMPEVIGLAESGKTGKQ
jgi:hypothetical protein